MQSFKLDYRPFPPELHGKIRGITGVKPNGKTIVLIDSTLSETERKKTLKHELAHIVLGHFLDTEQRDVMELEAEAEAKADSMTEEELNGLLQWQITA